AWADRMPLFTRIMGQGSIAFAFLLLGSLVMSVPLVSAEWVGVGAAATAVRLVMRLAMHGFTVLSSARDVQDALAAFGGAAALGNIADDDITADTDLPTIQPQPAVEIKNLDYSYPGGAHVLSDVSVTLQGGTTTALVGTSGAGKST